LSEDLLENISVGCMDLITTTKFEREFASSSNQNDFAGLENQTFICTSHADDLVVWDRNHGFIFDDKSTLVIED